MTVSVLDGDTICTSLSFLDISSLGRLGCVSRRLRDLASDKRVWNSLDISRYFRSLVIVEGSVWKGFSVEEGPRDKKREIQGIKKFIKTLQVYDGYGFTLLTLPKGLSLKKLHERYPFAGRAAHAIWEKEIGVTHRILITNNILVGSEAIDDGKKRAWVESQGCEMPSALEMVALHYAISLCRPYPSGALCNESFKCILNQDKGALSLHSLRSLQKKGTGALLRF